MAAADEGEDGDFCAVRGVFFSTRRIKKLSKLFLICFWGSWNFCCKVKTQRKTTGNLDFQKFWALLPFIPSQRILK